MKYFDNNLMLQKSLGQWLSTASDYSAKHLRLHCFKDTGRGIQTTKSIVKNAKLISIPGEFLITSKNVVDSYLKDAILKWQGESLTGIEVLCLYLVYEYHQRDHSKWSVYLNSLPTVYTDCIHWPTNDIDFLPEYIQSAAKQENILFYRSYHKMSQIAKIVENDISSLQGVFKLSLYKWAWSTVGSRSIYLPNKDQVFRDDICALAPFLDMFNHSDKAKVNAFYNKKSKCYEIVTLVPYKKYDQVFISYGNHNNCKLMINYGFILSTNIHEDIPITLEDVSNACKCFQISVNQDVLDEIYKFNLALKMNITNDGLSWNLLKIIEIISLCHYKISDWKICLFEQKMLDSEIVEITLKIINKILQQCKEKFKQATSECKGMAKVINRQHLNVLNKCSSLYY